MQYVIEYIESKSLLLLYICMIITFDLVKGINHLPLSQEIGGTVRGKTLLLFSLLSAKINGNFSRRAGSQEGPYEKQHA